MIRPVLKKAHQKRVLKARSKHYRWRTDAEIVPTPMSTKIKILNPIRVHEGAAAVALEVASVTRSKKPV